MILVEAANSLYRLQTAVPLAKVVPNVAFEFGGLANQAAFGPFCYRLGAPHPVQARQREFAF